MSVAGNIVALLASVSLLATACIPSSGPGATSAATQAPKVVKIYSSFPLTGASRAQSAPIVNAVTMALDEIDWKVGNVTIEYEALDDATAATQEWDATKEAENARKAAADKSAVVYIGPFNSGAAMVAIPILCQANLVMISPANTKASLTKPATGEADEPGKYYPNCKRNYTRVVPADDIQGTAGATWAKELGATKVFIVRSAQLYGGIADVFRSKAREIGLAEAGYEIVAKADNYRALATKVKDSGADFVYYSGTIRDNAAIVLRDIKAAVPSIGFMGPDGIQGEKALRDVAGASAEGIYSTHLGVAPIRYTGKALEWSQRYKARFGPTDPAFFAIYGYEAALVAIDALKRAGTRADDRATVRDAVFATKDFDGVLGRWSFDANGDTSLVGATGLQVKNGRFEFVKELK